MRQGTAASVLEQSCPTKRIAHDQTATRPGPGVQLVRLQCNQRVAPCGIAPAQRSVRPAAVPASSLWRGAAVHPPAASAAPSRTRCCSAGQRMEAAHQAQQQLEALHDWSLLAQHATANTHTTRGCLHKVRRRCVVELQMAEHSGALVAPGQISPPWPVCQQRSRWARRRAHQVQPLQPAHVASDMWSALRHHTMSTVAGVVCCWLPE